MYVYYMFLFHLICWFYLGINQSFGSDSGLAFLNNLGICPCPRWRMHYPTLTKWSCSLVVSLRSTMTSLTSWRSSNLRGKRYMWLYSRILLVLLVLEGGYSLFSSAERAKGSLEEFVLYFHGSCFCFIYCIKIEGPTPLFLHIDKFFLVLNLREVNW